MARKESGFLRAAAQSAIAAMEVSSSLGPETDGGSVSRAEEVVSADGAPKQAGLAALQVDKGGRPEQSPGAAITSKRSDDDRQTRRTSRELSDLLVDPVVYAREHSQRRVGGRLRTVDGRISADVAATFAAHCDADLGKISQADLVEVLIRAYLRDVGVEIRRPFT